MSREGGHRITSRVSTEEYELDHVIVSELATTEHPSLPLYHLPRPHVDLSINAQTSSLYWWTALTQWYL
ncbi:hypothetical protein N7465_002930, partial [Penicillium sp. CMV-2018d]